MAKLDLLVPMIFLIGILTLIALTSVVVAWRLLRWRMRYQADGTKLIVIPDALMERLDELLERESVFVQKAVDAANHVGANIESLDGSQKETYSRLLGHLSAIQRLAEDRLKEVERFREGNDYVKLKNYLRAVIRIIDEADQRLSEGDDSNPRDALVGVRDELIILLENNGIEQFEPPLGTAYKPDSADCKVVKREASPDDSSFMTIAEVRRPGYRLAISEDTYRIVREAEVVIYGKAAEGRK